MGAPIRPHGRVLVVDDDPLVVELIVGTLSEHGYAMRTATDARETLQVLRSLSSGMDHVEIARHLVITPKTVEKHIEHILLKLGVHSRAQAIALAFQDEAPIAPKLIELNGAVSKDAAS